MLRSYSFKVCLNAISKRFLSISSIKLKSARQLFDNEYEESLKNPERFWAKKAKLIEWYKKPEKILDNTNSPFEKWFVNGELNASYNCLDVHVKNGFGSQIAIIHDSPVTNTISKISYKDLHEEVAKFAGVLRKLGVEKGDTVLIYMPMIPQAVVAMLAIVRLGLFDLTNTRSIFNYFQFFKVLYILLFLAVLPLKSCPLVLITLK